MKYLVVYSVISLPTEYQTRTSHISKISRISRREKKDQHNDMVYFWRQNLTVLRLTKCRSFDYAHAPHKVHNWLLSMPQEFFFLWHKQTLFLMIYLRKHIDVLPSEWIRLGKNMFITDLCRCIITALQQEMVSLKFNF